MSNALQLILVGLLNTALIVVLSSALPFILGTVLGAFSSKYSLVNKIFGWLSLPFECVCPVLILFLSFVLSSVLKINVFDNDIKELAFVVLGFSIAFMGYMPARHIETYSFWKNTLYNGLGLISAIFKWSFCVSMISFHDVLHSFVLLVGRTYDVIYYIIPFVFAFVVLLIIEIARRIIKQFMK